MAQGMRGGMQRSTAELAAGGVVLLVAAVFLVYALVNTGRTSVGGVRLQARFENVGGIQSGADVRIAGVKVGSVTGVKVDPQTYQALVSFTVQGDVKLPADSSAVISSGGLLGGSFLGLSPGGDDALLKDGQTVTITQSAVNLEDLLGKFIFNVGSLADATQKSLQRQEAAARAEPPRPAPPPQPRR